MRPSPHIESDRLARVPGGPFAGDAPLFLGSLAFAAAAVVVYAIVMLLHVHR